MTLYLPMDPQPPDGVRLRPTNYGRQMFCIAIDRQSGEILDMVFEPPHQPGDTIQVPTHGDDSFDRGGQVTHYMVERKVVSVEPVKHDGRWQWKVEVEPAVKK